jgi:hypothetical protein
VLVEHPDRPYAPAGDCGAIDATELILSDVPLPAS